MEIGKQHRIKTGTNKPLHIRRFTSERAVLNLASLSSIFAIIWMYLNACVIIPLCQHTYVCIFNGMNRYYSPSNSRGWANIEKRNWFFISQTRRTIRRFVRWLAYPSVYRSACRSVTLGSKSVKRTFQPLPHHPTLALSPIPHSPSDVRSLCTFWNPISFDMK